MSSQHALTLLFLVIVGLAASSVAVADNIAIMDYLSEKQWALTTCPDPESPIISPALITKLLSETLADREDARATIVKSLKTALRRDGVQIYCILEKQLGLLAALQKGRDLEFVLRIDAIALELRHFVATYTVTNEILGELPGWQEFDDAATSAAVTAAMYERAGCRIIAVYCEKIVYIDLQSAFRCTVRSDNCTVCLKAVAWEDPEDFAAERSRPPLCECPRDFYSPVVVTDSVRKETYQKTICKLDGDPPAVSVDAPLLQPSASAPAAAGGAATNVPSASMTSIIPVP